MKVGPALHIRLKFGSNLCDEAWWESARLPAAICMAWGGRVRRKEKPAQKLQKCQFGAWVTIGRAGQGLLCPLPCPALPCPEVAKVQFPVLPCPEIVKSAILSFQPLKSSKLKILQLPCQEVAKVQFPALPCPEVAKVPF